MADFFDFSQPVNRHNAQLDSIAPKSSDLLGSDCCASKLLEDTVPPANKVETSTPHVNKDSGVTPFFGVLSDSAPGRPLAFDSNLRRLEFSSQSAAAVERDRQASAINRLQFNNNKITATLLFGLHMKF